MPYAPERSKLNQAPLEVRDYIQQLEKLARDGVELRNQVSAEFKIGKVSKDADGDLDIQVRVITKRGKKTAANIPLNQLYVNGEPMIGEELEMTNANGVWSRLYHTGPVDFLEFELELEQNGEIKKFSDVLVVQMPKEKRADKLLIISPEMDGQNIVKSHDSFGSFIILQALLGQEPIKAKVTMVSDIYFQYAIEEKISVASKKHMVEIDGQLSLTVLPSRDWQKITFFIESGEAQTFKFKKKN